MISLQTRRGFTSATRGGVARGIRRLPDMELVI